MLKTMLVLLIFILSLSHCVKCMDYDTDIKERLSFLSRTMGLCLGYFRYQRIDDFINGKLKLPNITMGDTVKLTFYKFDLPEGAGFEGILLPDESSQTVINKIQNGQLISYRVDFPLTQYVPELIKIFVNEHELCATEHYRSNETYVLKHTMQIINGSLPVFTYNINIPHFVKNPACGIVDDGIGLTPFIYGGSDIVRGEYPWLAAIYKKQGTENIFLCGGSLMSSRIILTAAHCFQGSLSNADKIIAELGRYNLTNNLEDNNVMNEIEALILHPEYKYGIGFSDADLAILKIKNPVSYSKFIKPICLWIEAADESLVVSHTGVVSGWGSDEDGNSLSAVPQQVKMDIISENACLRSSLAFSALTSSRTLCAGNRDGSGPCEGDSGGGLMINRYGRWMLRGVVSAGLTNQNRCNLKQYTVYCDVAKHRSWLEKYVKEDKIISGSIDEVCGISEKNAGSEYPWLAAIYYKLPTGAVFWYTGSLISSRTVLTHGASFVTLEGKGRSPDFYRIYLGRYDLNNIQENEVITRDVANIKFHPNYNKSPISHIQENGIALLQMKSPVDFTTYVKPICLWSEPNYGQSNTEDQTATLSSWENTSKFEYSDTVPKSMKVNLTSIQQCQSWGYNDSISSRILCVPHLEIENGAIMMFKRNGRWLLRGVSAQRWSYNYMSRDYFVYLDVAKYLKWIQKNMLT